MEQHIRDVAHIATTWERRQIVGVLWPMEGEKAILVPILLDRMADMIPQVVDVDVHPYINQSLRYNQQVIDMEAYSITLSNGSTGNRTEEFRTTMFYDEPTAVMVNKTILKLTGGRVVRHGNLLAVKSNEYDEIIDAREGDIGVIQNIVVKYLESQELGPGDM
ncbi:hypothetical protein CC1G_14048 [Coprinopsis cinerea okayama7|uniref:Uncharacterized protein n=1 Tax=Coprinopsis cinerea (strain Okayama-7 / 130 / ATCC MYA-4618 / FGSC 9003) TaxID=240176 RepID=D6RL24_COPC7|nr:hypothetical protein CC1G_14048 [Coprinopsis cinerea okayama7\|eukprot:XP_002912010.1 hypothetical protein CC1G_14048 [Coprinopsis cinerea okayama7\